MKDRIEYPKRDSEIWKRLHFEIAGEALQYAREHDHDASLQPLLYLDGIEWPGDGDGSVRKGATYKQLAYISHRLEMHKHERAAWYGWAEVFGLSQAHAGTIITRINERDAGFSKLEGFIADN
jgi:hypothetical protein